MEGEVYCNTSETYRLEKFEATGDVNEAGTASEEQLIKILGAAPEAFLGVSNITSKPVNRWLHCWFALDYPENDAELSLLTADLIRAREQYGENFVLLPSNHLDEFLWRVRSLQPGAFVPGRVSYSTDQEDWSLSCKPACFAYQREYRLMFGECSHKTTEPLVLRYHAGFADLLEKNPQIKILKNKSDAVWFKLNKDECFCCPDSHH